MTDTEHYIQLVENAQRGDKQALNLLAELASPRLHNYVRRITLLDDVAHDITQESILEMIKVLDKLKKTDLFWPWLEGIAFNKTRNYYGRKWSRRETPLTDAKSQMPDPNSPDGLADMIAAELKEAVVKSMQRLQPRQRAILALRCYEGRKYSEIARMMKCTEFGAQALFYRAKKALGKELSRCGFGKASLLAALVIFGKVTATSKAAAANVSVTAATLKVTAAASVAATVASKSTVLLTTAGVVAIGTVTATIEPDKAPALPPVQVDQTTTAPLPKPLGQSPELSGQYWYYFPQGPTGPLMMQQSRNNTRLWLQDEQANYHRRNNAIHIDNWRTWQSDLAVWRLPTDSPQLSDFISGVEGFSVQIEPVQANQNHLLVVAWRDAKAREGISWITTSRTVLQEDYFQCDWPTGTRTIDNRDAMHKRGWTYFTVTGEIDGKEVKGTGRLPFFYAASEEYWPWMKLRIDGEVFVDEGFVGFTRPWAGLHTIDTVRRDAAQRQIPFETKLRADASKAQVILTTESGRVIYIIDMQADVVEKIVFTAGSQGQLTFNYLQEIDDINRDFAKPRGRYRTKNLFEILEAD